MARRHANLRAALTALDIDQTELAKKLQRSLTYVNTRMVGKSSWTIDEAYQILVIIRASSADLARYFPPRGANERSVAS